MTGSAPTLPSPPTLSATDTAALLEVLAGPGLLLDVGAARLRLRSALPQLAAQLRQVYGHFPLTAGGDWADIDISIDRQTGLRRWLRPQIVLHCDGRRPFEPFGADTALPLFEWGCNWMIGQRLNHLLLLHAGAVERDGLTLLLPALPGSGKSTLTAALSLRGWRLLSDEFGAFDPASGQFVAMLKPVALKNASIEVIRAFEPTAPLGRVYPKTRKGRVAHLSALAPAVARRHAPAAPGAVVLPRWQAGSATRLEPITADHLFRALAFNAFNYALLGAVGFAAVTRLVRQCPAWSLVYSDLDDALAALDRLWPQVREDRQAARAAAAEAVAVAV